LERVKKGVKLKRVERERGEWRSKKGKKKGCERVERSEREKG
jgi:hypothetical protein